MATFYRSLAVAILFVALLYLLFFSSTTEEQGRVRKGQYFQATLRAEPLIEAIHSYTRYYHARPDQLSQLVPKFIDGIPDTGVAECDRFKYVNYRGSRVEILWYDLGSRDGLPMAKKSQYSDGDPGHAVLVFTLAGGDGVVGAKFDRMPKEYAAVEFDSEKWLAGRERIAMAADLPEKYELNRMPRSVLEKLLGHPDGVRVLRDTPWELRINCPRSLTERDVIFYWPTERYSEQLYGGNTELIGNWLFIR